MSNTNPKMMTLRCQAGNHDWQRASQRGRPPINCPEHTVAGADNKVGAAKKVTKQDTAVKELKTQFKTFANGANGTVADGEDISPQELQARMEREAAIRARTEKAVATKAAKKEAEKVAQREREAITIERMKGELDSLFARYDVAFESACKENTKQAWNKADSAQMAVLNTLAVIRKGVTV